MSSDTPRLHRVLAIGVTTAIVALLWLYTSQSSSYLVVDLGEMLTRFREIWFFERFTSDLLPSLQRFAIGYALAVVLGAVFGLGLGMLPAFRALMMPLVSFLRAIPPVAMLPPAIIILGIGNTMRVFIIAFICVWPIVLNTADGVAELDRTMLSTARAYGLSKWERLRTVILPATTPRIFAGMRTSLTFALLLMIISELVAGTSGIGAFLISAQQRFQIPDMWAAIILLGLLGIVLNYLFTLVERRVIHWHFRSGGK